jgi:hypothetical protein
LWAYVEWSEKRQEWCIEDSLGRCLKHAGDLRGRARWAADWQKRKQPPLYEALAEAFDFSDPDLWRSISYCIGGPFALKLMERALTVS